VGSFTTCCGGWRLTDGPLPRTGLRLTGVFLLVLAVGLTIGWIWGGGTEQVAELGRTAPDFTVEVIGGGEFTLSEQRGRPVVVNFWASWCEPCRVEIPDISAFADAHPEVTVVGVAVQDAEQTAREFAAEVGASYPLAVGTEDIEDAYPTFGLPATYVLDDDGIVIDVFNGIVDENTLADSID
jgi:cytochrome c biogenesis protein CcmG/thiol:disulfide interchange protein DsbE